MEVDFGRAALDYARHRAGFPAAFYEALAARGIRPRARADRAFDLATGTGTIARALSRRGWRVDGIDRSVDMLRAACRLDAEAGDNVGYLAARAEALPFKDRAFDLVTAGTCWHWFDRDRAAAEARRVLAPGGHLVIAALEWRGAPGNAVRATEDLIAIHNPAWAAAAGGLAFTFDWADDLARQGFVDIDRLSIAIDIPYSHEAWRGRIRASAGVGASLPPEAIARFDAELTTLLVRDFPDDPLTLPHEVAALVARRP